MGLPSCFLEKKFGKHEKGDDITPFDGKQLTLMVLISSSNCLWLELCSRRNSNNLSSLSFSA
jgi:hypothetical protein